MKNRLDLTQTARMFKGFPGEYGLAPLWYWNGDMRETEIVRQLRLMADSHIGETMIFPMAGLEIPYLSEEYFRKCAFAVSQAKKLGLKIWFYDEYVWPSGTAGGAINEKHPEYLMRALRFHRYQPQDRKRAFGIRLPGGKLLGVWAVDRRTGRKVNLSDRAEKGILKPPALSGDWEIYALVDAVTTSILDSATGSRWSRGLGGYLDVLNQAAVAKFLELTYDGYYRRLKGHFGRTVRGFFTDEPSMWYDYTIRGERATLKTGPYGTGDYDAAHRQSLEHPEEPDIFGFYWSAPWTADMLKEFRRRRGYELSDRLLDLLIEAPDSQKLRCDFWTLLSDLFNENYIGQISRWCAEHRVSLTGHFVEGFGQAAGYRSGDLFRSLRTEQIPGMDYLGMQKDFRMLLPKAVSGAARAVGSGRASCETHGGFYPEMRLSDKVRINDQLAVMGVNLNIPIDFAYSFRGFRKYTACTPGFYQSPEWPYQRYYSDRAARTNQVTSAGRPAAHVAAVVPTLQAVAETGRQSTLSSGVEADYEMVLNRLFAGQIDCDIINDTGLAPDKVKGGKIVYPGAAYDTLVLKGVRKMRPDHMAVLEDFVRSGGKLMVIDSFPRLTPEGKRLQGTIKPGRKTLGRGKIVFIPDFTSEVAVSSEEGGKTKMNAFDGRPETAWAASSSVVPQHLTIDFRKLTTITGCAITWEQDQARYAYQLQVSADGKKWRTVKSNSLKGQVQKSAFPPVKARYFRLLVTGHDHTWTALHSLDVTIREKDGREKIWRPTFQPGALKEALLREIEEERFLSFRRDDGSLREDLLVVRRILPDGVIVAALNRGWEEIETRAVPDSAGVVELWNQDTGVREVVFQGKNQTGFPATFASKELRIFVLPEKRASSTAAGAGRKRRVLMEIPGPWRFLAAGSNNAFLRKVVMFDPAFPERGFPSLDCTIPPELNECPVVGVRAEFPVGHIPKDLKVLFEEGAVSNIRINGKPLSGKPKKETSIDEGTCSLPIAEKVRTGTNLLEAEYAPEWYERHLAQACSYNPETVKPHFDVWLAGTFSIDGGRLVKPVRAISEKGWLAEGYPFYSGAGVYRISFSLKDPPRRVWLETDVNQDILEVTANGKPAGVRICEPYLVDVSGLLRSGQNRLELKVTNNSAAFMEGGRNHPDANNGFSGLRTVHLVIPLPDPAGTGSFSF